MTEVPQMGLRERFCIDAVTRTGEGHGSRENFRVMEAKLILVTTE